MWMKQQTPTQPQSQGQPQSQPHANTPASSFQRGSEPVSDPNAFSSRPGTPGQAATPATAVARCTPASTSATTAPRALATLYGPGRATLASASTLDVTVKDAEGDKTAKAKLVGALLAERAKGAGITAVVFDRGGFKYHGRVAALADSAREGGLSL